MARKVGVVNPVIRFCAECPYSKVTSAFPSGVPGMHRVPSGPAGAPGHFEGSTFWWFCGRTGTPIGSLTVRNGDCPLEEIDQFQQEMIINIGDSGNLSPG